MPRIERNHPPHPPSSLGPRMKWTSQVLLSLVHWHIKDESTKAALLAAKLYKTGKAKWRGRSPHHWSIQNFTLFPTPILNWMFLLKTSQPIQILFQKPHYYWIFEYISHYSFSFFKTLKPNSQLQTQEYEITHY